MKGTKNLNEFTENVYQYVKEALFDELSKAKVCVASTTNINYQLWL